MEKVEETEYIKIKTCRLKNEETRTAYQIEVNTFVDGKNLEKMENG